MLHSGLYEQVINNTLTSGLAGISEVRKAVAPIDTAEASKVLAQYLADVVHTGLDTILALSDGKCYWLVFHRSDSFEKVLVDISAGLWYMFVLQGGELMENKLLEDLYDKFYAPPEFLEQKREVEKCYQVLIEALEKPEQWQVIRIIDAKDHIVEEISIDSFISGFKLAWKLSTELNNYENEHPVSCRMVRKLGARFTFKKGEEE